MARQGPTTIVLDTSVLLNFVNIGRLELLGQLGTPVVLLDQVLDEIRRPEQRETVEDAVAAGILDLQSIRNPVEVALFAGLRVDGRLGAGECPSWPLHLPGIGLPEFRTEGRVLRASAAVKIWRFVRRRIWCWR